MTAELTRNGYLIDGVTYPRVSSILAVIAKPGLDGWKRKVGFEEADRIAETSTTFGMLVHKQCERVSKGEPADVIIADLERGGDRSAARCVDAFARWLDSTVERVIATEHTVWSDVYGVAGTADLVVELKDGRRAVVDIKTSKSLSETYRIQLEAYRLMLEERGEPCDTRLVVWLPSSHPGTFVEREYADHETDRRAWRACVALHRFLAACRDDWKTDKDLLAAVAEVGRP